MLIVDNDLCIGCEACEDNCAFAAIEVVDGLAVVGDACTLCGSCVDSCEVEALTITGTEKNVQMDLASWKGIWVYCEFRAGNLAPVSLELLGIGRKLADDRGAKLSAVLIGASTAETAETLIAHGADIVYRADHQALTHFTDETYGAVLTHLIQQYKPEVVLAGATAIGRSFIPGVANALGAGLTADCTQLAIQKDDGALLQTRPAFGGNIMATIVCPSSRPQMSTVRPKVMKELDYDANRSGEIIDVVLSPEMLQSKVRVIESVVSEHDDVNIQEAEILVGGGRGLDNEKGFKLIQ